MDCHRARCGTTGYSGFPAYGRMYYRTVASAGGSFLSHLRTVIVTAAVYRGFSSSLAALPLTFRHRAGVSPYTSPYGFAETCVFSKQSAAPLSFNPKRLRRCTPTPPKAPLLPNSLGYFAAFLRQISIDRL